MEISREIHIPAAVHRQRVPQYCFV